DVRRLRCRSHVFGEGCFGRCIHRILHDGVGDSGDAVARRGERVLYLLLVIRGAIVDTATGSAFGLFGLRLRFGLGLWRRLGGFYRGAAPKTTGGPANRGTLEEPR